MKSRRYVLAALVVAVMADAAGCAQSPVAVAPAPRLRATMQEQAFLSSASRVQSLPEYHQAQAACQRGQYRQAAQILAQLAASPALTAEQQAFTRTQQQICLTHLAPPTAVSKSDNPKSKIKNVQSSDCGPRALLLVCQKLGVQTTLPALTKAAGTGPRGTSMAGLQKAAEALKLKTEGLQVSREALPEVSVPALLWVHGNHYAALLALRGRGEAGTALIHDPNEPGEQTISQEQLLQASSGYLLTIRR